MPRHVFRQPTEDRSAAGFRAGYRGRARTPRAATRPAPGPTPPARGSPVARRSAPASRPRRSRAFGCGVAGVCAPARLYPSPLTTHPADLSTRALNAVPETRIVALGCSNRAACARVRKGGRGGLRSAGGIGCGPGGDAAWRGERRGCIPARGHRHFVPPRCGAGPRAVSALAIHRLTACELEIVELIDQGLSNKQIARRLSIEPSAVKTTSTTCSTSSRSAAAKRRPHGCGFAAAPKGSRPPLGSKLDRAVVWPVRARRTTLDDAEPCLRESHEPKLRRHRSGTGRARIDSHPTSLMRCVAGCARCRRCVTIVATSTTRVSMDCRFRSGATTRTAPLLPAVAPRVSLLLRTRAAGPRAGCDAAVVGLADLPVASSSDSHALCRPADCRRAESSLHRRRQSSRAAAGR